MIPPMQDLAASWPWAWPELTLAGFALIATLIGAWGKERAFGLVSTLGVLALIAAGVLAIVNRPLAPVEIFQGAMVVDGLGVFAKALIAFAAAATLAPASSAATGAERSAVRATRVTVRD